MTTQTLAAGRERWTLVFLAALAVPVWCLFHGLTTFGLLNNAEGIYAEIAREMLAGGSWVIPHLDGLPYIEKPPLFYWLLAASIHVFGANEFAVRLVPVMAGLLSVLAVGWFATVFVSVRCGLIAAYLLGTSMGFLAMSKVALVDALLSLLLNASLLLTYAAWRERRRHWLRMAFACLALAILAKGLVALALYGLVGTAYLAVEHRGDWREVLRFMVEPWALALFALLVAPWHIAASLELKEFAWFYFVNEHVLRFLGLRVPRDYYSGSIFYYLPRLAGFFFPWCLLLLGAWFWTRGERLVDRGLNRYLWCGTLAPLVFFSLSSAKANYYMIVCLPTLALLAAVHTEQWLATRGPAAERALLSTILIGGLLLVPMEAGFTAYANRTEANFSARPMAHLIAVQAPELPVFLYHDYEDYSGLPFYLQSTVGVIDSRSEDLLFGSRVSPNATLFVDTPHFLESTRPAWVVVRDPRQRQFQRSALVGRLERVERVGNATLYRWRGSQG